MQINVKERKKHASMSVVILRCRTVTSNRLCPCVNVVATYIVQDLDFAHFKSAAIISICRY